MMGRVIPSLVLVIFILNGANAFSDEKRQKADIQGNNSSKTYLMWHFTPSDGATPELTSRIESKLRSFFNQLHSQVLMDGMVMDSLLLVEGNEKFLRCGKGAGCLSGLGELAGMKYVIAGSVSLVSHRTTTTLYLVDVKNKHVKLRASVQSMGVPSREKMQELAIAMFEPRRYKGSVIIVCPVSDAEVFLDGKPIARTPLKSPLSGIVAGEHLLELKKPGRQPFSKTVLVPMGEETKVMAVLPEVPFLVAKTRPFYSDWPFWTAAGVGVIATAVAGGLYYSAGIYQENADKLRSSHSSEADSEQDKADSRYFQSYIMFGLGGAGILASGVIALVDVLSSGQSSDDSDVHSPHFHLMPSASGIGVSTLITF